MKLTSAQKADITMTALTFLTYGTLRPGGSNYPHFVKPFDHTTEPVLVTGFAMYSAGSYPFILPTGDPEDKVVCDAITITNPEDHAEVEHGMDRLEGFISPGHPDNLYEKYMATYTMSNSEEDNSAIIYIPTLSLHEHIRLSLPLVASGDWIEHQNQNVIQITT